MIAALKMNFYMFSGSNPLVVFAKASIHMYCKIQTLCVKTNLRVSFTPPEVMNEECVKILYYHHENFTMCQRVMEIRMNEGNNDSSKHVEPNFSEVFTEKMYLELRSLFGNYYSVYGYDYSHCIYEVEIYTSLTVLQKFEIFLEKIPHDAFIAFIDQRNAFFVPLFVKALLSHLGRKPPIDAKHDSNIVKKWLSNNEPRRDLILHASSLSNMKAKFIINLSNQLSYSMPYKQASAAQNATSQYTFISLPLPSKDEGKAITFLSAEKNKQSDEAYPMHRKNLEQYLRRTD